MTVVEIRHASKRFGPVTALDGLDFRIQKGEIVGLLGRNGAGKTTAVRLLLGLSSPDSGTIRVFGNDPRESETRKRIGAMLQVAHIRDTAKPAELIDLFSSYYANPMPYAQVVDTAMLHGLEQRLVGKLSGGEKQRVLFAIAICGNPDLLVLDEPTVGLDAESRRGLWKSIRAFAARGSSVLLTTHYLEEADALSNRVVVIDHGRVLTEGSPQEIKKAAGDAATLEDAFLAITDPETYFLEIK